MEEEYYIREIGVRTCGIFKNKGRNVAIKLFKRSDYGYMKDGKPWEFVWVEKYIHRGTPVFVVMCFHSESKEFINRMFLREDSARTFLHNTTIPLNTRHTESGISFCICRTIY